MKQEFRLESCSEQFDFSRFKVFLSATDNKPRISFENLDEFMDFFKSCNENLILIKPDVLPGQERIDDLGIEQTSEYIIRVYDSWNE